MAPRPEPLPLEPLLAVRHEAIFGGAFGGGARPGRARLGMTLESLLWFHCSISGRCLLEYSIGTQSDVGAIPSAVGLGR